MGISVGYPDWSQISTMDADLDIGQVGSGNAPVTFGPFDTNNWLAFSLIVSGISANLLVQWHYFSDSTLGTEVLTRQANVNVAQAQLQACIPNVSPWMTVSVESSLGGAWSANIFGWRTNRTVPSYAFVSNPYLLETGSISLGSGAAQNQNLNQWWSGSMGYNLEAVTQPFQTIFQFWDGASWTDYWFDSVVAGKTANGLIHVPFGQSRAQTKNTGAGTGSYSLTTWPVWQASS